MRQPPDEPCGLVVGQAQVVGPEHAELVAQREAVEAQGRVAARAEDDVEAGRQVVDEHVEVGEERGVAEPVEVLDHEDRRRQLGGGAEELVDEPLTDARRPDPRRGRHLDSNVAARSSYRRGEMTCQAARIIVRVEFDPRHTAMRTRRHPLREKDGLTCSGRRRDEHGGPFEGDIDAADEVWARDREPGQCRRLQLPRPGLAVARHADTLAVLERNFKPIGELEPVVVAMRTGRAVGDWPEAAGRWSSGRVPAVLVATEGDVDDGDPERLCAAQRPVEVGL